MSIPMIATTCRRGLAKLNMSKKDKGNSTQQGQGQSSASAQPDPSASSSPITVTKGGEFSIPLQVKPGSKVNCITDISSDCLSLQIAAPPVDGEANVAIVKFFAEILKVKKADIQLRGGKSRQKTLFITSTAFDAAQLYDLLKAEIGVQN